MLYSDTHRKIDTQCESVLFQSGFVFPHWIGAIYIDTVTNA